MLTSAVKFNMAVCGDRSVGFDAEPAVKVKKYKITQTLEETVQQATDYM